MDSNKKYCLFPKPHLTHLLFIFYFISSMVKSYIFKGKYNLSSRIIKLYAYNIGDLLSIFPYLIIRLKIRSNNINNISKSIKNTKGGFSYIYTNIFNKMKKRIIINIFIISIIDFIAQISKIVFYIILNDQKTQIKQANINIVLIFNVIFLFLLTKFILDITFYLHHYFSFLIFIVCLLVIVIIDFIEINTVSNALLDYLLYIVISIFEFLLYSIESIMAKIMFLKYYYSPYLLLFFKASIQFFYFIIFSIPFCFVKFKDEKEEKTIFLMFSNIFEERINILYYIIYIINSFFYNILYYLIVDNFSPTHSSIAYIFENLGVFIINTATEEIKIDYKFAIRFIMYILLIIATLIFNEFLVINLCGLANNTKLFLDYKEKNDLSLINEINFDINGNNNDDNKSETDNEENIRESLITKPLNGIELSEI